MELVGSNIFQYDDGYSVLKEGLTEKPVVLVDLDETLVDTCSVFLDYISSKHDIEMLFHDLEHYDLDKYADIGEFCIKDVLQNSGYIQKAKPFKHALNFVQQLQKGHFDKNKYHVAIVTHRGSSEEVFQATQRQLHSIGIPYNSLHVVSRETCKLKYLQHFECVPQLVVEDNTRVLQEAIRQGITTVCHARPWNTDVRVAYRIRLTESTIPYRDYHYHAVGSLL